MSDQQPEPSTQSDRPNEQGRVIAGQTDDGRVYVVSSQSMAVESAEADRGSVTNQVPQPDKVMRIATMTQKLLDEIKAAPLDDPSRRRLAEAYAASIDELKSGLDTKLADELERITEPFAVDAAPTDAELRVAQAQLVGWLEGLFQGIQTALFAQQMAARAQLEQMRRALPPGAHPDPNPQPGPGPGPGAGPGMYL